MNRLDSSFVVTYIPIVSFVIGLENKFYFSSVNERHIYKFIGFDSLGIFLQIEGNGTSHSNAPLGKVL